MNKIIVTLPYRGVPHQYYLQVDNEHRRFHFHPTFAQRDAPTFQVRLEGDARHWDGPEEAALKAAALAEVEEYLRSWPR